MDEILITMDFMKFGWVLAVPLVIVGILTYIKNSKFIEWFFAFIKAFFYGSLGFLMWKYVNINEIQEIGIVTAFTCIFCCIECGDNLVKVFGMAIQVVKNTISTFRDE